MKNGKRGVNTPINRNTNSTLNIYNRVSINKVSDGLTDFYYLLNDSNNNRYPFLG